jgi:hypothetical protein
MYELIVEEKRTPTRAAEILTREGYKTRAGGLWTMKRVQQVLLSPVNAGYAVGKSGGPRHRKTSHAEVVYKDGKPHMLHKGILSPKQWEAAKNRIEAKPQTNTRMQRRSPFLSGLVYCGACNRKMVAGYSSHNGRVYRRYVCPGYAGPRPNRCANGFSNVPLEEFVMDYTRVTLKDSRFRAALDRRAKRAADPHLQDDLLDRSHELREALEALQRQLHSTLRPDVINNVSERMNEVSQQASEVAEQLERTRRDAELSYSVEDIFHALRSMDPADHRYAVESVVDRIVIEPGKRYFVKGVMGGSTVDLSRIKIRRKYAHKWDQLSEPTPAPVPTKIECAKCHELVDRTDFIRLHSKSCPNMTTTKNDTARRSWIVTLPADEYSEESVESGLSRYDFIGQLERGEEGGSDG